MVNSINKLLTRPGHASCNNLPGRITVCAEHSPKGAYPLSKDILLWDISIPWGSAKTSNINKRDSTLVFRCKHRGPRKQQHGNKLFRRLCHCSMSSLTAQLRECSGQWLITRQWKHCYPTHLRPSSFCMLWLRSTSRHVMSFKLRHFQYSCSLLHLYV